MGMFMPIIRSPMRQDIIINGLCDRVRRILGIHKRDAQRRLRVAARRVWRDTRLDHVLFRAHMGRTPRKVPCREARQGRGALDERGRGGGGHIKAGVAGRGPGREDKTGRGRPVPELLAGREQGMGADHEIRGAWSLRRHRVGCANGPADPVVIKQPQRRVECHPYPTQTFAWPRRHY